VSQGEEFMAANRGMRVRKEWFGVAAGAMLGVVASVLPVGAQATAIPTFHRYGLKPIHQTGLSTAATGEVLALQSANTQGAIAPQPKVYLVFWGSQWATKDPAGAQADLPLMFGGLFGAKDTWGTILNQYCEGLPAGTTSCGTRGVHVEHPATSPVGGTWTDTSAAAPAKATAAQIGQEAVKAAAHFGNTTQAPNLNAIYVVVSPTGTDPDMYKEGGFCAWHNFTGGAGVTSPYGNLAFVNQPYTPDMGTGACTTLTGRLLDGLESTVTHEYAEAVTDFWPAAGWNDSSGAEIGDICASLDARVALTTGTFDLQGLWSNDKNSCVTSEPGATPPPPVGPPGAPTNVASVANGGSSATVSWTAPASDGGAAITYYAIYAYSPAGTTNMAITGNPASYVETGLSANQNYTFTVLPWNGSFWGSWSAWAAWTLVT